MSLQLSDETRSEIVRRLVESVSPLKIVLFGSFVHGAPDQYSDLDLLVIKQEVSSKYRESIAIQRLLSDIPLPKDILVASAAEYEFYKKEAGSVLRTAFETGVELYGR